MGVRVDQKRHLRILRTVIVVGFLSGSITALMLGRPGSLQYIVHFGNSGVLRFGSGWFVRMELTPMGYPIPGQSWSIYVYNVSRVGGVDTFKPLPNASVLVTLKTSENVRNYTISTNENGQVSFPFLPEYADVAFRASASGTSSASIVISMHYVSSGILDLMSIVEFPLAIVGFITSVQAFRVRKLGRIVRMLGIVTVTTFAITGFFSIYARFYQETLWGYPEVLIKLGAITMSVALLEYLFFFGLAMLSLLAVCTIYGSKRK